MTVNYDPEMTVDHPPEVHMFDELCHVRENPAISDGTVFYDDAGGLGLVGPDVTRFGDEAHLNMDLDPSPAEYDRTERVERKGAKSDLKLWVFTDGEREIAIKWEYVELVRDIYEVSLDEIREAACVAGEPAGDHDVPPPILIDIPDRDYLPMVMPHLALED